MRLFVPTDTCYDPIPDLGMCGRIRLMGLYQEPFCKATGADVGRSLLRMFLFDDIGPADCAGGASEPEAFYDFPVPTWYLLDCEPIPDLPSEAWLQGWAAYAAGVDFTANPHEVLGQELQDDECGEWAAGWEAAEAAGVEREDCDDEAWQFRDGDCAGSTWDHDDGYPAEPDNDDGLCVRCGACSDIEAEGRCQPTQDAMGEYGCPADYLWWAYPTGVVDAEGEPDSAPIAANVASEFLSIAALLPSVTPDPDMGRDAGTYRGPDTDGFWGPTPAGDVDERIASILAGGAADPDPIPVAFHSDPKDHGLVYPDQGGSKAVRTVRWLLDGELDPFSPGFHRRVEVDGDCGGHRA